MSLSKPTKKQSALLAFVERYSSENDRSPSYREIMQAMHLRSVSAVAEHVDNCVARGFLEKRPFEARSLRVIPIETHTETVAFFRQKLTALENQILSLQDDLCRLDEQSNTIRFDADTQPVAPTQNADALEREIKRLTAQVKTLRSSADILEIEL